MRQLAIISVIVLVSFLVLFGIASGRPTVEMGLLLDLSGHTSELGKAAQRVAEMAIDQVNSQGGVDGRLVKLTAFDTRGDPILGKQGARELVSVQEVAAVVGPTNWATAMMTKPIFEERQTPVMMLTWDDSVIRGGKYGTYEYIFQLPLKRSTALEKVCAFVKKKGWTRVGLVVTSDALGREAREWFMRVSSSCGIRELVVISLAPTDDITEKLRSFADRDLQTIVSWCTLPRAASVTRAARGLGMNLPLFQCHEMSPQRYVEMAGREAERTLTVTNKMMVWQGLDERDPQKGMIEDFLYQYRDVYRYGRRRPIGPALAYVWDSVMILVRAMRVNGTDGTRLRDIIEATQSHVGLGGIYGFTHEDHNGLDPDSLVVSSLDQVHGDGRRWVGSWSLAD